MKLIAITNDAHSIENLATMLMDIHPVVDFIHIREKSKSASQLVELLELLQERQFPKEKLVMNDRVDVALLNRFSNVHLPTHSLPVSLVKQQYPHLTVGRSVHSLQEALQAEADGADYVLYGHCYETNCKPGISPNGIALLQEIKAALTIPIFAIGGIQPVHIPNLLSLQTDGIAIMSGIFSAPEPALAAKEYALKIKEVYELYEH